MKQLKVSVIENNIAKHIDKFLGDLIMIVSKVSNDNHYQLDEKLKSLIITDRLRRVSNEDISNLLETVNSIINIGKLPTNEIQSLAIKEHGEEIFKSIENELGLSKDDQVYIIDQVKLTYQSRLILILFNNNNELFQRVDYDVFLSHNSIDSREVLGIKLSLLYDFDKVSYVDWIDDFELNKQRSTEKLIKLLSELLSETDKIRLKTLKRIYKRNSNLSLTDTQITNKILGALDNSNSFLYIDSKNSRLSKWMSYELGYAEARKKKHMYRIIIKYKRKRKGIIKYNSFLSKYESINDLQEIR